MLDKIGLGEDTVLELKAVRFSGDRVVGPTGDDLAVAHRDYSIYTSKIRLRMFADRLEISSPGALANTMSVESLAFRQSARNEAVSSLLAKCTVPDDQYLGTTRGTLMDKRGEGVSVILERGERHAGRRPLYRVVDGEELQLTIYGAQLPGAPSDARSPSDASA